MCNKITFGSESCAEYLWLRLFPAIEDCSFLLYLIWCPFILAKPIWVWSPVGIWSFQYSAHAYLMYCSLALSPRTPWEQEGEKVTKCTECSCACNTTSCRELPHLVWCLKHKVTYVVTAVTPCVCLILTAVTVEQGYAIAAAAQKCAHSKNEQE